METGEVENDYDDYRGFGKWYNDEDEEDEGEDEENFHYIDCPTEQEECIKKLVSLDGRKLRSNIKLQDGDLYDCLHVIPECTDPFECIDGEEEYEGYMGNWVP
jgi:hypothetical protein